MLDSFEFVHAEESLCAGLSLKQGQCQDGWIGLLQAVMAFFIHWLALMIVAMYH